MKGSKEYFKDIAAKAYLSPSQEVLDDCVEYLKDIELDLSEISSFDTDGVDIYYSDESLTLNIDTSIACDDVIENESLLKELVESYGFSNIKDSN